LRLAQLSYNFDKMKAKDHYDNHLSQFYAWMVGSFEQAQLKQEEFLRKHAIFTTVHSLAIDLGAGHGLQAVSLAKLGYKVSAVDFSKDLLNELEINKRDLAIQCQEADLLTYLETVPHNAEAIVCMGDTLTHLESTVQVEKLISLISNHLTLNGKVVLSFRDLTHELTGDQRFILVRSDETRILTCYLEYFADHVQVHDILYEFTDGKWIQKVSSYPKLRLSQQSIEGLLKKNDIELLSAEIIDRMVYLVGKKS
jgi:predicted TPR repeat methyltransferase